MPLGGCETLTDSSGGSKEEKPGRIGHDLVLNEIRFEAQVFAELQPLRRGKVPVLFRHLVAPLFLRLLFGEVLLFDEHGTKRGDNVLVHIAPHDSSKPCECHRGWLHALPFFRCVPNVNLAFTFG